MDHYQGTENKNIPVEPGGTGGQLFRDQVNAFLPDGGKLNVCFSCGICASGCPASGLADMDPRRFVRMLSMGLDEEIFNNDWVWMCTTCNRCVHVCPMEIDIPQLVLLVRKLYPLEKQPAGIRARCERALDSDTCSAAGIDSEDFKFIVEDVADDVRQTQKGFEQLAVPVDKKRAMFFLNQSSDILTSEPGEMAPLWKILHIAGADWTYASKGWAAENYCMFLAGDENWEKLVSKKAGAVEKLENKVLLNTECGHDFFAIRQGLEKFNISHSFEVKNIIEYYAIWIRSGSLKVTSDWNRDLKIKFTVQDPCQLVRKSYGDFIADELRYVIRKAVGEENFIDMSPNRSNNYCCGGGGGAIRSNFVDERLEYGRIKLEQILETGADYCITPCSNCHSQILDLSRHSGAGFHVVHLWTILCLAMGVLGKGERKYLGGDLAGIGML